MLDIYVCRKYDKVDLKSYVFHCYLFLGDDNFNGEVGIIDSRDQIDVVLEESDVNSILKEYRARDKCRNALGCSFIHSFDEDENYSIKILIPSDILEVLDASEDNFDIIKICKF